MLGSEGITLIAFKSSEGFWHPYILYGNGPYPGSKGPPKGWEFACIVNGREYGHKPANKAKFNWETSDEQGT